MNPVGHRLHIVRRVARLLVDARYILACMLIWYATAAVVGHKTARGAIGVLRKEDSAQPEVPGLEPLFRPNISYKRSEIMDPRLVLATVALFVHNAVKLGAVLYLGSLMIFIPPLLVFAQGWLMGAVLEEGGWQSLLHRTMPHGLIELPVILAASSVAMLIGYRFYRAAGVSMKRRLLDLLKEATVIYIVCLPLLFIAAGFEGYGTRVLWG